MRISDWSSDVCSSDLRGGDQFCNAVQRLGRIAYQHQGSPGRLSDRYEVFDGLIRKLVQSTIHDMCTDGDQEGIAVGLGARPPFCADAAAGTRQAFRSEERRVGKGCVSTGISRGTAYHKKK